MASKAGGLGSLNILLGLDTAEFSSGLTKAEHQAQQFVQQIGQMAKTALQLLAVEEAIRRVVDAGARALETAAHLYDLGQRTGMAAEELSVLAYGAKLSGTSLDEMLPSLDKFAATISEAARGAEEQAELFAVMKIGLRDARGELRPTNELLLEFADRISSYSNSAQKVALVRAAFGRGGGSLIPFLNEGAEGIEKMRKEAEALGIVWSEDTAKAADKLDDAITALKESGAAFGKTLLISTLPTLQIFVDKLVEMRKASDHAGEGSRALEVAVKGLAVALASLYWLATGAAKELGALAAQVTFLWEALNTSSGEKMLAAIRALLEAGKERRKDAKQELEELQKFIRGVSDTSFVPPAKTTGDFSRADRTKGTPAPELSPKGARADFSESKKALEGYLKSLQEFFRAQQDGWQFANSYLQEAYSQGLLSLEDFFASQKALRDAALQAEIKSIDSSIAAYRAYAAALPKTKTSGVERLDVENKIAEAQAKRAAAVQKATEADQLAFLKEARAIETLKDKVNELQASVLAASGDTLGASAIRIAKQQRDAVELLRQAGQGPELAEQQASLSALQAELKKVQEEYSALTERSSNAEDKLLQDAIKNNTLNVDLMQQQKELRAQQLEQLEKLVDKANELALALGTPEAIAFAERLSASFRKAANEVDPFLTKIRDLSKDIGESLASSAEDAIVNFRSLRDVISGLEKDIVRLITRKLVTEKISDWFSSTISSWLSSSGGSGGGGGGGSWVSAIGSFVGSLFGGKAGGGLVSPYSVHRVNEFGPELLDVSGKQYLMMGPQTGSVVPSNRLGTDLPAINLTQIFNVEGKPDLRSQTQIGAAAASGLARASYRNN